MSRHVCLKVTDASVFYADNLSLTYVLSRLILCCGVSLKMEPVEDSPSAKKCLTATAGAAQWRCTRSCLSLITRHFLTVSLMYCLFAAFFTSKTVMYNNTFIYVSVHFIFDLFNEFPLTISSFGSFYFGL